MKVNKRKWLNPPHSYHTGSIHWSFENDDENNFNSVDLTIRDCSRSISLSLEIDTEKEKQASLKKLRIIVDAAVELTNLIEAHDCAAAEKKAKTVSDKSSAKRRAKRVAEQIEINKEAAEAVMGW